MVDLYELQLKADQHFQYLVVGNGGALHLPRCEVTLREKGGSLKAEGVDL